MKQVSKIFSRRLVELLYRPVTVKIDGVLYDISLPLNVNETYPEKYIIVAFFKDEETFAGSYFDLRHGAVSFHPKPELQKINHENELWSREGRQVIRIGKLFSIFSNNIIIDGNEAFGIQVYDENDPLHKKIFLKYCEEFTFKVIATLCTDKIQISDDPSSIYRTTLSDLDVGTLGNSCMRKGSDSDCRHGNITYNRWNAKIAYITDKDEYLMSRALIWENVLLENGMRVTFMDRIYGNETHVQHMKDYAIENGWFFKVIQSSDTYNVTNGTITSLVHCVNIPSNWEMSGAQPYMDTFTHVTFDKLYARIEQMINDGETSLFELQSTSRCFCRKIKCAGCGEITDAIKIIDGKEYCNNCVLFDDYNNELCFSNEAVRYYTRDGRLRWVNKHRVEGLVVVRDEYAVMLCEPLDFTEGLARLGIEYSTTRNEPENLHQRKRLQYMEDPTSPEEIRDSFRSAFESLRAHNYITR